MLQRVSEFCCGGNASLGVPFEQQGDVAVGEHI
jgi:hypothetical protein